MRLRDVGLTKEEIKAKVDKYMIETYERFDMIAERGKGMYVYDENGTPYLDFYAGIAVNSAGSCNDKVVLAVIDQCMDIMQTFNYPYTVPQALLAEKICTTIGMDKIFFQNSGAEANEAMIKMARKYGVEHFGPNKYEIITAKESFHGRKPLKMPSRKTPSVSWSNRYRAKAVSIRQRKNSSRACVNCAMKKACSSSSMKYRAAGAAPGLSCPT